MISQNTARRLAKHGIWVAGAVGESSLALLTQTLHLDGARRSVAGSSCNSDSGVEAHDVCVVSAARTPLGSFQGALSNLSAPQLGEAAIRGAMDRVGLDANSVDEAYIGNVLSAGLGQAPGRQAAIGAQLPHSVACTDVNKVCASGMKAVMLAAQSIQLGTNRVVVAGGMESMSNAPYYLLKARGGYRLGHGNLTDGLIKDGLWDPYSDTHMGNCGELCAATMAISREQQDEHALRSFTRAMAARDAGLLQNEVVAVEVAGKRRHPAELVCEDEALSKMDPQKLRHLRPVFKAEKEGGTITAGNASPISDGAAALVLMSGAAAKAHGLPVIAKIKGYADGAQAPEWFTTAPSLAIPKALKHAGLQPSDVDYYEINEAFSVVDIANQQILKLDPDRVNVTGGAVALGHPIGCSGARILVTLLNVLRHHGGRYGAASICNGGGGASAVVLENCIF